MTNQDFGGEALLVLDAKLNVCAANKPFYELFRLAPDECIGYKVYEVGGKSWDAKLRTMLEAVVKRGSQSDHFELIHDKSAPGHGVLWLSAKTLPSSKSGEKTILLSIQDLNARRTAEESLTIATDELETFAELASRAAHELNNLLTVIRMNAELLEPDLAAKGLSVEEVQGIVAAADRAERLTRQLLVSSRRALPQRTGLDRATAAEAADLAVAESGSAPASEQIVRALRRGEVTGRETILLVEDEKTLRTLQKRILTEAGYRVLEAADGEKALLVAADEGSEIDLVVTDVEMPALGGRGMVDELNELTPGIRVLVMSGYTDNELLRRGIGTAETQFLEKPFTAEAFKAAVQTALARPATAST
jgi:CheY-like chemotaxis protein